MSYIDLDHYDGVLGTLAVSFLLGPGYHAGPAAALLAEATFQYADDRCFISNRNCPGIFNIPSSTPRLRCNIHVDVEKCIKDRTTQSLALTKP